MQYLAPSCLLLLSVLVYGETLTPVRLAMFGLIWIALALYAWDALRSPPAGTGARTGAAARGLPRDAVTAPIRKTA